MSDDLSEFHAVFFEESDELIENMEAELLEMLSDATDPERINTVFRAAHSIKGGSATFGFDDVAKFTHVMETLLDEVREGRMEPDRDLVDLLLRSTDCLRAMMDAAKAGTEPDRTLAQQLMAELEQMLSSEGGVVEPVDAGQADTPTQDSTEPADGSDSDSQQWRIFIRPGPESLKTANDPLAIFSQLAELGEVQVALDTTRLPQFEQFEPDTLYLAWHLNLTSQASEQEIREIFDWIDVTSEITIEKAVAAQPNSPQQAEAPTLTAVPDKSTPDAASVSPAPSAPSAPAPNAAAPAQSKPKAQSVASIRVGIDKIDKLINLVGELVITQSMLNEEGQKLPQEIAEKLHEGLSQLQRHTRELQENVMQIRMVPISNAFNRLPRMIHDLTNKLNKKVELKMSGEQTELDKTVLESIGDPLVHLVRNAVDHGIELPDVRVAAGKSQTGELQLNAYHESGNIVIEIRDDGAGIDRDKVLSKAIDKGLVRPDETLSDAAVFDLLFHPGFSTAEQVSDVSGRGVGMDVVRRNIQSLGGSVEVDSKLGAGSVFTIRLPLTLAIVEGQLVKVGEQTYVIPLISIVESIQLDPKQVNVIAERGELYRLRNEYIPLVSTSDLFSHRDPGPPSSLVVVVESELGKMGLLVDDLLAQQQVVIKSLETNYKQVPGIAGATILGDGTVSLILDINGVISMSKSHDKASHAA